MTSKPIRRLKPIIYLILFFFCWTNLGIYNIAYAAANGSGQGPVAGGQQKAKSPEEKFQESLERLREAVDKEDTVRIKAERAEIEKQDVEIKKQFAETEEKIKGLPEAIKQRHRDFVKKYEENLNTLKGHLNDIEKARTKAEIEQANAKIKEFLEKTKSPLKHPPFQPSTPANHNRELKPIKTSWLDKISDAIFPSAYAAEPPLPNSSDLADTLETPLNQEIHDLATNLGGTPVRLYEFVRNSFAYEPYAGSVKGAIQTLKEKGGNEWDLASLLIALYRASGFPARYVVGTVEIPADRVMSWLGVEDANMAASLLLTQGRPTNVVISGGKITAIRTQHVWVQAYVPFLSSRGATSGPGETWIDLDPSFKMQIATQSLSLRGAPEFDQTNYLSTLRPESPLDYYRNQLQSYINTNAPGYLPEALSRKLETEQEWLGILIGQPPYTIKSIIGTYSEVPDSYRQKFTVSITNPYTGEADLSYAAPLPQVIGKRLTLSYVPATSADEATVAVYGDIFSTPPYLIKLKPIIKLDGTSVAEGNAVGSGEEQTLQFIFDTTIDTGIVENIVIAGGYYAIGLNAQTGSGSHQEVLDRSQKLASITDTIKFNEPSTLDDRLGELLHLSAMVYHQNLNMAIRKIAPLHKVIDTRDVSEIMYSLTVKVDDLFGVPRKITPVGITGDMDRDLHTVIPVDGNQSRIKPYMLLESSQSSFLEHNVTEKVYQTEAISAVKGIQLAHDQGIPVYTITNQNISASLPLLQVSAEIKADIANAVNAGQEVIVPEQNITLGDWTGVGYIIQDPTNGKGAYLISGGYGGVATVHTAAMRDVAISTGATLAQQATNGTVKEQVCYPGLDNYLDTPDDVCYTAFYFGELDEYCGDRDPECRDKYAVGHDGYEQPLIDFDQYGPNEFLTRYIKAWDWQSQDNAKYMRTGTGVITAIENMMKYFNATIHNLRPNGAGYRTKPRNAAIGGSRKSHHKDGVAADTRLEVSTGNWVQKCQVLWEADWLIGGFGEVLAERTRNGTAKTTVHVATPGLNNRDYQDRAQWQCQ